MTAHLSIGDLSLDVHFKNIKNVHLSVRPPHGRVTVSAPSRMSLETVRAFVSAKLGWIRRQQRKLRTQARETQREFLNSESHFLWGKRYLLRVVNCERGGSITVRHRYIVLHVPANAPADRRNDILARWYRDQIRAELQEIIARWSSILGVGVAGFKVKRMKTKWGSCNHISRTILLNTELAKKPKECLEYVLVHEMVHMLERRHNDNFTTAMDRLMPNWRLRRSLLNELPLAHEEWKL